MAELAQRFRDFLSNIRLSDAPKQNIITAHRTLRKRLREDDSLAEIYVETFLQGSYRRSTIVKSKQGKRSDVDVVIVTRINRETTPQDAMEKFAPFLDEHYKDKWKYQGRSLGIELSYADLDLVVTSAPSEEAEKAMGWASVLSDTGIDEVEDWRLNAWWPDLSDRQNLDSNGRLYKATNSSEWKTEPLWIPDREAQEWQETNPLEQIRWTFAKNKSTNKHYVNVVKAIKWWRRVHFPEDRPKGYPLEHLVGDCCPDELTSVAQGITETLEEIVSRYQSDVTNERTPSLQDRGTSQDVMARISADEFATFHEQAKEAAAIAREALELSDPESTAKWQELFGREFPNSPDSPKNSSGGPDQSGGYFTGAGGPSSPRSGRFG